MTLLALVFTLFFSLISAAASATEAFPAAEFAYCSGVSGQRVTLVSPLSNWELEDPQMQFRETSPGCYALSIPEPWLSVLPYKFVVDGRWISDPKNPNSEPDGYGNLNSLRVPKAFKPDPLLAPLKPDTEPGIEPLKRRELRIRDWNQSARKLTLLYPAPSASAPFATPPATPGSSKHQETSLAQDSSNPERLVLVVFQDGDDYLNRTGAANLLARLGKESGMPALAGLFIPPRDRMAEYAMSETSDRYLDWLQDQVLPRAEQELRVRGRRQGNRWNVLTATDRVLIGPSLGGLITTYTAIKKPWLFGFAASQSGSFWFDNQRIVTLLQSAHEAPSLLFSGAALPELFLEVGTFEAPSMLSSNRAACQTARKSGWNTHCREYPSLHNWEGWENRLSEILRTFLKRPAAPL